VRRAWIIVAGALSLAACAPVVDVPLDLAEGEILIVGVVETERPLPDRLTVLRVTSGEAVIMPQLSATEVLVGWRAAAGYLVNADGDPYALGEVVVRPAGAPAVPGFGDCGRCPVQNIAGDRQIIHPGASCVFGSRVVPLAGDATSYDRAIEIATNGVRFDWPGACGCAPDAPPAPVGEIEMVPVAPGRSTYPHTAIVETPDGHIALIDERHAVVIDPLGGSVTSSAVPLRDPIVAAIGSGDNEIFVATYASTTDGVTWWKTDTTLSTWQAASAVASSRFTPEGGVPLVGVPGGFVAVGALRLINFTSQPIMMVCGPGEAGGSTECREIAHSLTQIDPDEVFRWVYRLPDDSWITVGSSGTFVHVDHVPRANVLLSAQTLPLMETPTHAIADGVTRTSTGSEVAWRLRKLDNILGSDSTLREITRVVGVTTLGQSAMVCVQTNLDAFVLLRRFTRAELGVADDGRDNGGFEIAACRLKTECGQMVTTGTTTEVVLVSNGYERLRFDEQGLIGSPDLANLGCAPEPTLRAPTEPSDLTRFEQWRPERWVGATSAGRVVVGEVGRAPRVIYGSPVDRPDWNALVRDTRTDDVWAFGPPGQIGRITRGAMTVEPLPGLPAIRAAAVDHSMEAGTGFTVIAMTGAVLRVTRTPRETAVRVVEIPPPPTGRADAFLISEAAPGTFVIGVSPRALWRVIGDAVAAIPITFDDPATLLEESGPPLREKCIATPRALEYGISGYRKTLELRAMSSAEGVTWVVGCGALILRVVALGPEPKAFGFNNEALFANGLDRVSATGAALAVGARCADSVLIGLTRYASQLSSLGVFVDLSPSADPEDDKPSAREPAIGLYSMIGGELSMLKEIQVGATQAILIDHSPPAFTIAGNENQSVRGGISRFTGHAFRISAPTRAVVETANGGFVLAIDGGEVFASPP